jgi:hypothetical protein
MNIQTHYVCVYIYRVYQNSAAKLQERTPHTERRKKVYDNMGLEMHNYRVIRACNLRSARRHFVCRNKNARHRLQLLHK